MKKLLLLMLSAVMGVGAAFAASLVYGIQVYSSVAEQSQAVVSFPVDAPAEVQQVYDLSQYNIVAAAANDGIYYLLHSDDGLVASKLLRLDLNRMLLAEVKTFDWKVDVAARVIYTDMTYDADTETLYASGFDIEHGSVDDDGQLTQAPFALYRIDPATGDSELIGSQEDHSIVALSMGGGELLGVADNGSLQMIDTYSGELIFELMESTGITPVGIQSMSYDSAGKCFYWASYASDSEGNGVSQLMKIYRDENWEYHADALGKVGDECELIGLYVDSDPLPMDAPAMPTDFTVTPGTDGAATAALKWTNPGKTIGGQSLTDFGIEIYRDDELVNTVNSAAPGKEAAWNDDNVPAGMHTYSIVAFNGNKVKGKVAYADEQWIGVDVPGSPASATAVKAADSYAITVSWTAPEKGLHGGWFDATDVKYTVVRYPDNKTFEGLAALSLVDNDITEAHGYYYDVTAMTSAGGKGGTIRTKPVASGKPHTVPYAPDFNEADDANQWTVVNADNDEYEWYTDSNWGGTRDTYFRYYPSELQDPTVERNDWLISPAIALEAGKRYVVQYDVRLLGDLFPANITFAMGNAPVVEAMTTELERIDGDINDITWTTHATAMTVETSGTYHFGYQIRNSVPVQFYKFVIKEVHEVDLAVSEIHGSGMGNIGKASEFEVTVNNLGFNAVDDYVVELIDSNDNVLASADATGTLASQTSAKVVVSWTPGAEGSFTLRPRVVVAADGNEANNVGTPVNVTVFGEGTLVDVGEDLSSSIFVPISPNYRHSAAQSIYTSDMIGFNEGAEIKAAIYTLSKTMGGGSGTLDIDLKYSIGNVEQSAYENNNMLPEENYSNVFDGNMSIDLAGDNMVVVFSEPFLYGGGNLGVYARHDSEAKSMVLFVSNRPSMSSPRSSCYYTNDNDPFVFGTSVTRNGSDLPKVTFLVKENSGVSDVDAEAGVDVLYDRASHTLVLAGSYTVCRIYSVTGTLLGEYSGRDAISVESLPAGVAVVEVTTPTGRVVKKIAI